MPKSKAPKLSPDQLAKVQDLAENLVVRNGRVTYDGKPIVVVDDQDAFEALQGQDAIMAVQKEVLDGACMVGYDARYVAVRLGLTPIPNPHYRSMNLKKASEDVR